MSIDNRPLVFLGIPYVESVAPELVPSIITASIGQCRPEMFAGGGDRQDNIRVEKLLQEGLTCRNDLCMKSASLHGMCFNALWCEALNLRASKAYDYFCMHHSDIGADPGWLDTLVNTQRQFRADVVSAVVPIKDFNGVTSTAIAPRDDPGKIRRLTMTELYARHPDTGELLLPDTFSANDLERVWGLPHNSHYLYLNTGLWVADFHRSWIEKFPGFNVSTWITRITEGPNAGLFMPAGFPEDWAFSKWCQDNDLKILATRAPQLSHWGRTAYHNRHAWGKYPTDMGSPDNLERATKAGITEAAGY